MAFFLLLLLTSARVGRIQANAGEEMKHGNNETARGGTKERSQGTGRLAIHVSGAARSSPARGQVARETRGRGPGELLPRRGAAQAGLRNFPNPRPRRTR